MPVPDKGIVSVGSDALDAMVTLPVALPAACGANATLNVMLAQIAFALNRPDLADAVRAFLTNYV